MGERRGGIGELPEGCIANIISFTSPPDACRFALVSPSFKSAADSDTVWKGFLPPDYVSIVSESDVQSDLLSLPSKKELFLSLCHNPILIDGETKSIWLDKWSGKKCYMLAARVIGIIWSDHPQYWTWINLPDSRFNEVAELKLVWWLAICGHIDTSLLSPFTIYVAYLVFRWGNNANGFGWSPAMVSVGITGIARNESSVCFAPEHDLPQPRDNYGDPMLGLKCPSQRRDGWVEIELGEYFNGSGEEGEVLAMSLKHLHLEHPKIGLIVQGIEIRPQRCYS